MTLRELKTGQSAVIESVGGEGATRQHFLDMGVIPGAEVTLIKLAPMGDPMELRIHGYELTLRLSEAEKIGIKTDKKMVVDTVVRKNAEREKEAAALRDKPERSKSMWIFRVSIPCLPIPMKRSCPDST